MGTQTLAHLRTPERIRTAAEPPRDPLRLGDAGTPESPDARPPAVPEPRAAANAVWTIGGYAAMQVLRFGGNLVLTQLLFPEVFGLMALVMTFLQGLTMVSDVAIGPCVVQSRRGGDPDFLNTAWTLQAGRGLFLWAMSAVIAWPIAFAYGEPSMLLMLPAVGATMAVSGFSTTARYTLNRDLNRARLVLLDVGCYAASLSVTIGAVWLRPDAWALVIGAVFGTVLQTALGHLVLPGVRNRFRWEPAAARELGGFGRWLFLSSLCTFLATQMDKVVIGKWYGLHTLGVYNLAAQLSLIPVSLMSSVVDMIVFPMYSRLHRAGQDIRTGFMRIHLTIAAVAACMVSLLIGAGPTVVHCLYHDRYAGAGEMVQLLAAGAWLQMLQAGGGGLLLALGRTRPFAAANALKLVALVALVPLGWHLDGFRGVVLAFVATDLAKYAATAAAVRACGLPMLSADALLTVLVAVISAAALAAGELACAGNSPWLQAACQVPVVLALWGGLVLLFRPDRLFAGAVI